MESSTSTTAAATATDEASEACASGAEPLSKSARKRLLKAEGKEQRKDKRREEKKIRKAQRKESAAEDALLGGALVPAAPVVPQTAEERLEAAWAMWSRWGAPQLVLAPMVNQSYLAFRMLARQQGAQLTYTPMLHSTTFAQSETYRRDNFDEHPSDRPLVVQFCGDDPATLLAASRYVETRCDMVDLNCGCPQGIARRGHYGAFLLDEPDLIVDIVRTLSSNLSVPVSVKVRILPGDDGSAVDVPKTVAFAQRLQAAGASLLTVHGRTRAQKCACMADWKAIRAVKQGVSIPVIANGGVETPEDLRTCLEASGADGVMTSEAALESPGILAGEPISRLQQARLARAYVEMARAHPARSIAVIKAHFFKMLYMALQHAPNVDMRDALGNAHDAEAVFKVVQTVCEREEAEGEAAPGPMSARCDHPDAPFQTWYRRHRGAAAAPSDRYGSAPAPAVEGGLRMTDEGLVAEEACCAQAS